MVSDKNTLRTEPLAAINRIPSSTSSLPLTSKQHQLYDVKLYRLLSIPLLSISLPGKFALARLDISPVSELSGSSIRSVGTIVISDSSSAKDQFIDALATLILAKKVIEPTQNYVLIQKYDNARSNLKYVLNQLQLQKKVTYLMRNSVDFCDDIDAVEAAGEAGNRLTNTVLSFDNTVYTCIFIPTDSDDLGTCSMPSNFGSDTAGLHTPMIFIVGLIGRVLLYCRSHHPEVPQRG